MSPKQRPKTKVTKVRISALELLRTHKSMSRLCALVFRLEPRPKTQTSGLLDPSNSDQTEPAEFRLSVPAPMERLAARMGRFTGRCPRDFSWRLVAMRRSCPWQLHPARIVSHSCRRSIRGHQTKWQMRNQNAMNAENLQVEGTDVESSKPFVDFTRTQSTDIGTLPCRQETFTADMTSCRRSMSGSVHLLVSLSFLHRV